MNKSISTPVAVILVVVAIAIVAWLGYYWLNRPQPVQGAAAKLMEAHRHGNRPYTLGPGGQPPPGVSTQSAPPAGSTAAQNMMNMYRATHSGMPSGAPPTGSNP